MPIAIVENVERRSDENVGTDSSERDEDDGRGDEAAAKEGKNHRKKPSPGRGEDGDEDRSEENCDGDAGARNGEDGVGRGASKIETEGGASDDGADSPDRKDKNETERNVADAGIGTESTDRGGNDDDAENDNAEGTGKAEEGGGRDEAKSAGEGGDANAGTNSSEPARKYNDGGHEHRGGEVLERRKDEKSHDGEERGGEMRKGDEDSPEFEAIDVECERRREGKLDDGEEDEAEESGVKKMDGEEGECKYSPESEANHKEDKSSASPAPPTDPIDGTLTSNKRKRKRAQTAEPGNGYIATSSGVGYCRYPPPKPPSGQQAAAMMNPMMNAMMMNPMNGMMHPHQMMAQQQMFHNNLMQAQAARASFMAAAANGGIPPPMAMAALGGGGGTWNNTGNSINDEGVRLVTLTLPVDGKLGIVLDDDAAAGVPALKSLAPDSPVRDQIPEAFRSGCHVGFVRSERTGLVRPRTAKECVELIGESRKGASTERPARLEVLLVRTGGPASDDPPRASASEVPPPPGEIVRRRPGRPRGATKSSPQAEWQRMYKALVRYHKRHGDCDVPPHENPALAGWVWAQRRVRGEGMLSAKNVERLERIDFDWNGSGGGDDDDDGGKDDKDVPPSSLPRPPSPPKWAPLTWEDGYEALIRFKERCGLLPNSGNLHEWVETQREAAARHALSPARLRVLVDLGVEMPLPELADRAEGAAGEDSAEGAGGEGASRQSKRQKFGGQDDPKRMVPNLLFWRSVEAAKLFGFRRGDDVIKGLQERIELLKKANQSVDGWKSLVPNDDKLDLYSQHDIMIVRHKAQYMIKAYLLAMEKMNQENWRQCCNMAADQLSELGLEKLNSGDGVARWNAVFRVANTFPHPRRLVVERKSREDAQAVRIFDYFPRAKEHFVEFANANVHRLTGKLMQEEFRERILPALERESREVGRFEDGSKEQKMLIKLMKNPPSQGLVLKWMAELGIEWDQWCTRKGRAKDGGSYLSQRMAEAWASGKYANRRPRGQGLKKGEKRAAANEGAAVEEGAVHEEEIATAGEAAQGFDFTIPRSC